jgi:AraC family transcriptional regulator
MSPQSNFKSVGQVKPLESRPGCVELKTREVSGFLFIEGVYPAGTTVREHAHEQANMCIALTGRCCEGYGSKVREYEPLTLDYLPAGVTHSLEFPQGELRCFGVDIAPEWLARMREVSKIHDQSLHCQGGLLANLFLKLYKEFHMADSASAISIEGLTLEMIAETLRQQSETRDRTQPAWLKQTIEMLHSNYSGSLSLAAIAQAVGVHPVHLAREFRKHYRCTIGEYIRRLRIENACAALSDPDLALSSIASAAGFADQSHFSRTFKRLIGMTPAEYRTRLVVR